MNINRNNYEEYFLLYADNELTQTEKKVVEIFLQENVDLKEEFLMIQMTVNSPEKEIKLLDKSFLLKKAPAFINEINNEDIFVLYHDNELSEEQKRETEEFVAGNAKFKNDFELIGKTKLIPEKLIIYPNKKELYRKEKSGKVIPLVLWRSLAAAVFIGFGIWVGVSYFNKNELLQPVATTTKSEIKKPGIKESKPDVNIPSVKSENKEETVTASNIKETKIKTAIKKSVSDEVEIKEESIAKTEVKTKNNFIEEKIKSLKEKDDYQLATIEPVKELAENMAIDGNSLAGNSEIKQQSETELQVSQPNHAHSASYISDADQKNDNYVFYGISAEEFRKSKVGGFLKKVRRIVERTNPISRLLGEEEQMAAK